MYTIKNSNLACTAVFQICGQSRYRDGIIKYFMMWTLIMGKLGGRGIRRNIPSKSS